MAYLINQTCTGCTACVRWCPVNAITGERKQLHSINPSLCIDCGACSRICPVDCIFDQDNQPTHGIKPGLWQKPTFIYEKCTSCRICILSCPAGCLAIIPPEHLDGLHPGQPYLAAPKACMACEFCAIDCPSEAIQMAAPLPIKNVENQ